MTREGTRSNVGLIAGNHDTPNTQMLLDPSLPVMFNYEYGGPGQQEVVVSKGMALALTGKMGRHYETGRFLPILTIADSNVSTHQPIGVAGYNLCEHQDNVLTGNKPVILNDKYIELPYIPDADDAKLVKWGAVIGEEILPGDWVKPASGHNKGKLTKWNPNRFIEETMPDFTSESDETFIAYTKYPIKVGEPVSITVENAVATALNHAQIKIEGLGDAQTYSGIKLSYTSLISDPVEQKLGQVLEAELDQEPWGWLKWATWDETAMGEDFGGDFGTPDPDEGFGFDPRYRDGWKNRKGYLSEFTTNPTGVPGLLDGSNKDQKQWIDDVEVVQGTEAGTIIQKSLTYKNVVPNTVKVNMIVGSTETPYGGKVDIDYKKGLVSITVDEGLEGAADSGPIEMVIRYRAFFYGTPTGWDHKGAVGAIRLLLQR